MKKKNFKLENKTANLDLDMYFYFLFKSVLLRLETKKKIWIKETAYCRCTAKILCTSSLCNFHRIELLANLKRGHVSKDVEWKKNNKIKLKEIEKLMLFLTEKK